MGAGRANVRAKVNGVEMVTAEGTRKGGNRIEVAETDREARRDWEPWWPRWTEERTEGTWVARGPLTM